MLHVIRVLIWSIISLVPLLPLSLQADCSCVAVKEYSFNELQKAECAACRFSSLSVEDNVITGTTRDGTTHRFAYSLQEGVRYVPESSVTHDVMLAADLDTNSLPLLPSVSCTNVSRGVQCTVSEGVEDSLYPEGFLNTTLIQVANGDAHACAANSEGQVFCWGSNQSGQLGGGVYRQTASLPIESGLKRYGVTDISVNNDTSCALVGSRDIYCWGRLFDSQYQAAAHTILPHVVIRRNTQRLQGIEVLEDGLILWHQNGELSYEALNVRPLQSSPVRLPIHSNITSICQQGGTSYLLNEHGDIQLFGQPISKGYQSNPYATWSVSWLPVSSPYHNVSAIGCDSEATHLLHDDGTPSTLQAPFVDDTAYKGLHMILSKLREQQQTAVAIHFGEKAICVETANSSLHCTSKKTLQNSASSHRISTGSFQQVLLSKEMLYLLKDGKLHRYSLEDPSIGPKNTRLLSDISSIEDVQCADNYCCALGAEGTLQCFHHDTPDASINVSLPAYHQTADFRLGSRLYVISTQGWLFSQSLDALNKAVERVSSWEFYERFLDTHLIGSTVCAAPKQGGVRCFDQDPAGRVLERKEARGFAEDRFIEISGRPGTYLLARTESKHVHALIEERQQVISFPGIPTNRFIPVRGISSTLQTLAHGPVHSCATTSTGSYCFHHTKDAGATSLKAFKVPNDVHEMKASLRTPLDERCSSKLRFKPECLGTVQSMHSASSDSRSDVASNLYQRCEISKGKVLCHVNKNDRIYYPFDELMHSSIKSLHATDSVICGLSAANRVYCWGEGLSSSIAQEMLSGHAGIRALSSGRHVLCAQNFSDSLYCMSTANPGTIYE